MKIQQRRTSYNIVLFILLFVYILPGCAYATKLSVLVPLRRSTAYNIKHDRNVLRMTDISTGKHVLEYRVPTRCLGYATVKKKDLTLTITFPCAYSKRKSFHL